VSDAVDLNTSGWAEVTTVAFGPGEHSSCPDGRLLFQTADKVLMTTLDGARESMSPNPWRAPINETPAARVIYDNHLVKLKDGTLLMTVEGATWQANLAPLPFWWEWTALYPTKERTDPGARGVIWLFRSADCGASWSALSPIDAARLEVPHPVSGEPVVGLCGTPRRRVDENDVKSGALGGRDGHFVHADPYSGHVFLATPCIYGTTTINEEKLRALLLRSVDGGASWRVIGHGDGKAWRAPLASRPDRVAFVYARGQSIRAVGFQASAPFVELFLGSKEVKLLTEPESTKTTATQVNTNIWRIRSIAPSSSGFLVSVPVYRGGALAHVVYEVDKSGGQPREIETIRAPPTSGGRGDTVHGTFIPGVAHDTRTFSAFYWVQSRNASATSEFTVRFQVYLDNRPLLETPGLLTIDNGGRYHYPFMAGKPKFVGDYMGGASYQGPGTARRFVATWSESGKLHFNTISMTFDGDPGRDPIRRTVARIRRPERRIPASPLLAADDVEAPAPVDPKP
jgi:hypothetical protein